MGISPLRPYRRDTPIRRYIFPVTTTEGVIGSVGRGRITVAKGLLGTGGLCCWHIEVDTSEITPVDNSK